MSVTLHISTNVFPEPEIGNSSIGKYASVTVFPEAGARSCGRRESGRLNQPELGQGGYAVIKAYLLDDLAIEDLQHRRAAKAPFATRGGWETANQKVVEGGPRVSAPPSHWPTTWSP
jgi:hypothetical protein